MVAHATTANYNSLQVSLEEALAGLLVLDVLHMVEVAGCVFLHAGRRPRRVAGRATPTSSTEALITGLRSSTCARTWSTALSMNYPLGEESTGARRGPGLWTGSWGAGRSAESAWSRAASPASCTWITMPR